MKPTALIIEDNLNMAAAFEEAIAQAGYDVMVTYNGSNAISYLVDNTPHLVLLDLHIPIIQGNEVLEKMKHYQHLNDTHIILTTADDRMAQELEPLADLVLLKPIGFSQLKDIASRMLPQTP